MMLRFTVDLYAHVWIWPDGMIDEVEDHGEALDMWKRRYGLDSLTWDGVYRLGAIRGYRQYDSIGLMWMDGTVSLPYVQSIALKLAAPQTKTIGVDVIESGGMGYIYNNQAIPFDEFLMWKRLPSK